MTQLSLKLKANNKEDRTTTRMMIMSAKNIDHFISKRVGPSAKKMCCSGLLHLLIALTTTTLLSGSSNLVYCQQHQNQLPTTSLSVANEGNPIQGE